MTALYVPTTPLSGEAESFVSIYTAKILSRVILWCL